MPNFKLISGNGQVLIESREAKDIDEYFRKLEIYMAVPSRIVIEPDKRGVPSEKLTYNEFYKKYRRWM